MFILTLIIVGVFFLFSRFLFEIWNKKSSERKKERERWLWEEYWNRIMREAYEREKQNNQTKN